MSFHSSHSLSTHSCINWTKAGKRQSRLSLFLKLERFSLLQRISTSYQFVILKNTFCASEYIITQFLGRSGILGGRSVCRIIDPHRLSLSLSLYYCDWWLHFAVYTPDALSKVRLKVSQSPSGHHRGRTYVSRTWPIAPATNSAAHCWNMLPLLVGYVAPDRPAYRPSV